jgi:hypothetical protein
MHVFPSAPTHRSIQPRRGTAPLSSVLFAAVLAATATAPTGRLFAQEASDTPPPAPTPVAGGGESLIVTVTSVRGIVQARPATDQPWQTAKVGMTLPGGAELRTGPRSQVVFSIPPDQTVALDRLGIITVIGAIRQQGKTKTDIGLKYGRTVYNVEAAGVEHETTIHTPGATLAVRGTTAAVFNQGQILQASVADSTAVFTPSGKPPKTLQRPKAQSPAGVAAKNSKVLGEMNGFSGVGFPGTSAGSTEGTGAIRTVLEPDATSPAELALASQNLNDNTFSLDSTESTFQSVNPGLNPGGGLGSDFFGSGESQTGPAPPPEIQLTPGSVTFMAMAMSASDVDFAVESPNGLVACNFLGSVPNCSLTTLDGGVGSGDDPGPNPTESVNYDNGFTPGIHTAIIQLFDGTSASFDITVTQTIPGESPTNIGPFTGTLDTMTLEVRIPINVPGPSPDPSDGGGNS